MKSNRSQKRNLHREQYAYPEIVVLHHDLTTSQIAPDCLLQRLLLAETGLS